MRSPTKTAPSSSTSRQVGAFVKHRCKDVPAAIQYMLVYKCQKLFSLRNRLAPKSNQSNCLRAMGRLSWLAAVMRDQKRS